MKKKEFEKLSNEGKIGQSEAQEIATRTDTLSYALLAEISTFHQQRVKDMKTAHQHFLQEQITFYQKVSIYFFLKVKGMVVLKIFERSYCLRHHFFSIFFLSKVTG